MTSSRCGGLAASDISVCNTLAIWGSKQFRLDVAKAKLSTRKSRVFNQRKRFQSSSVKSGYLTTTETSVPANVGPL